MKNRVSEEAIRSAIYVVLSLWWTCGTVHYLGERALTSSFVAVFFWWSLSSNAPIMLYNIRNWLFFLSQGNWWTKCLAYPTDVCVFGCFGWLSPAAVQSADCQFDSRIKWWICFIHHHIFTQKLHFVALK